MVDDAAHGWPHTKILLEPGKTPYYGLHTATLMSLSPQQIPKTMICEAITEGKVSYWGTGGLWFP
jgi:hypothetical protein